MRTIYRRLKTTTPKGRTAYRYKAIQTGRGIHTKDLTPPFYVVRLRNWVKLDAQTFATAQEEAACKFAVYDAEDNGVPIDEDAAGIDFRNRVTIANAIAQYLELKKNKAKKTVSAYRLHLNEFAASCVEQRIRFVDEVSVTVLRRYLRDLEAAGRSPKTIDNRISTTYFLLKKFGNAARIPNDELPEIDVEAAEPFSDTERKKLFAAMNATERLTFRFFLGSGCREQEVTFAAWSDLDLNKSTFTVRKKPDVGFFVKTHESRTVQLPSNLVAELKQHKQNADGVRWLFPSKHGKPDGHFLRKLKAIALRAGLNCGHCRTTRKMDGKLRELLCKTHPVCEHFILHRFRKTCATRWHEDGVPVRTIQAWLGHESLETTMIYLGITDGDKLQANVDRAFGD